MKDYETQILDLMQSALNLLKEGLKKDDEPEIQVALATLQNSSNYFRNTRLKKVE